MTINVYPRIIRADASAIAIFTGPPLTALAWSLTGAGTLTQADPTTNAQGVAKAVFTPSEGDQLAIITVEYTP